MTQTVMNVLRSRHGVSSGQKAVDHSELLVNYFDERRCAIGGTRSVGHNVHGLLELVKVHTIHKHRSVLAWSANYYFFCASHDVFLSSLTKNVFSIFSKALNNRICVFNLQVFYGVL